MRLEPSNNFFQGLLEWGRRVTAPQQPQQVASGSEVSVQPAEAPGTATQRALRPVGTRGGHLDVYA